MALDKGARKAKADIERNRARTTMRASFQWQMTLVGRFSRVGGMGVDMNGLLVGKEAALGYLKCAVHKGGRMNRR
jgi:hypothetical protein